MTKRQRQVAIAAGPVFLSRGYTRTTMGDIADAAGLSRQGLYLVLPNKEAVFAAAVRVLSDAQRTMLIEALPGIDGLRARLDFVCEAWMAGVFDLQRANPDARDMDDLAFPVVRETYQRFATLIADLIAEEAGDALPPDEIADLARTLLFGIRGYSATARDASDMRRLTTLQIELIVRHVEAAVAGLAAAAPKRRLRA